MSIVKAERKLNEQVTNSTQGCESPRLDSARHWCGLKRDDRIARIDCRQLACLLAGWVLAVNSHLPTPPACLRAEFEARDVTLAGDLAFEVPDGHRMLVTAGADGALHTQLLPLGTPTWQWQYSMTPGGEVQLELLEGSASAVSAGSSASAVSAGSSASA